MFERDYFVLCCNYVLGMILVLVLMWVFVFVFGIIDIKMVIGNCFFCRYWIFVIDFVLFRIILSLICKIGLKFIFLDCFSVLFEFLIIIMGNFL